MKTSMRINTDARRLFHLCMSNGLLDELRVRKVVQKLLWSKRRGTHALLSSFLRLVRLDHEQHLAEVESATSLSTEQQAGVLAGLRERYGPGIHSTFLRNPELIGGMRIRIGNDVYDGSVKARLKALVKYF